VIDADALNILSKTDLAFVVTVEIIDAPSKELEA
jgi:hypothetical protein